VTSVWPFGFGGWEDGLIDNDIKLTTYTKPMCHWVS